jgi:hypothetical protein
VSHSVRWILTEDLPFPLMDRDFSSVSVIYFAVDLISAVMAYYCVVKVHSSLSLTFFGNFRNEHYVPLSHEQILERLSPTDILTPSSTKHHQLLCALVATGSQLLICGLIFLWNGPFTDDSMNGASIGRMISLYVWTSPVSGFLAVFINTQIFQGEKWVFPAFLTAIIYPLLVLISVFCSSSFQSSSQYELFLFIWFGKVIPLSLVTGFISSQLPDVFLLESSSKSIIPTQPKPFKSLLGGYGVLIITANECSTVS